MISISLSIELVEFESNTSIPANVLNSTPAFHHRLRSKRADRANPSTAVPLVTNSDQLALAVYRDAVADRRGSPRRRPPPPSNKPARIALVHKCLGV